MAYGGKLSGEQFIITTSHFPGLIMICINHALYLHFKHNTVQTMHNLA